MEQLVARKAHNLEVVSSSLAPATKKEFLVQMINFNNIENTEREEETSANGYTMS